MSNPRTLHAQVLSKFVGRSHEEWQARRGRVSSNEGARVGRPWRQRAGSRDAETQGMDGVFERCVRFKA